MSLCVISCSSSRWRGIFYFSCLLSHSFKLSFFNWSFLSNSLKLAYILLQSNLHLTRSSRLQCPHFSLMRKNKPYFIISQRIIHLLFLLRILIYLCDFNFLLYLSYFHFYHKV